MILQLSHIQTLPITFLLILVLTGVGSANNVFAQNGASGQLTIELLPDSNPRFYQCGTINSPINGTVYIAGFTSQESAQNVLTDNNPNTGIMGDARFTVHFAEPLVNVQGPELSVIELHGGETFNASINDPIAGHNSLSVFPTRVEGFNDCDYFLNEALIDLNDMGVTEGSSISSISFSNLGREDSLLGADIADISIIQTSTNVNMTPP